MKKLLLLVATAFALTLTVDANGQDGATSAPVESQVVNRSDTAEYQAFSGEMVKYKDALKKLRALKESYQGATPEEKDKILEEFTPLVEATQVQQKNLIPLAIKAYDSIEGQNAELRAFLCSMLQWLTTARENYEAAYEVAKCVFKYPLPENGDVLYAYAAFAAFCTMNLDDAKTWTDIAIEKDVLSKADPSDQMHVEYNLRKVLPEYVENWAKEKEIRDKEAADDNLPRVVLHTTKGDIVLELFLNEAPIAVNNFLTLVKDKFYTDVPFHRVLPFFMAQGGDPTGTGTGGPGYCIRCECKQPNARNHFRGSLSMAHAGVNTGGSQFFLTFVPTDFLNGKHTVFGRIVEGMDVLSDIQRIDPEKESEVAPDKIVSAEILRGEPGPFEKLPGR